MNGSPIKSGIATVECSCYISDMDLNLPNKLTLLRIALIPVIGLLILIPYLWSAWAALAFYIIACVTDWLDGYLAREMKVASAFGRFLDPIADKLLVASLLLLLAGIGTLYGLWLVAAVVILFREILISGLREFLGPQNIVIHVSKLAKWKTASQMVALGFLIIGDTIFNGGMLIGQILLTMSAILTAITGWEYLKQGMKAIQAMEETPDA